MELGAKGKKDFIRILRLAGIPEASKDMMVVQNGETTDAKLKVTVKWESS